MTKAILHQPQFQHEDSAREYLESLRWPNGVVCPHCVSVGELYRIRGKSHRKGLWKCANCREQFTVTVGTVFERSKIKLHIWLMAVHLVCAAKYGISSMELHRLLGVTQKTAWFMLHSIREVMKPDAGGLLGSGSGTIEADETYWVTVNAEPKQLKDIAGVDMLTKKRLCLWQNVAVSTIFSC